MPKKNPKPRLWCTRKSGGRCQMRRTHNTSHGCGRETGERIDCLVSNVIRSLEHIDPTRGGARGARQQLVDTLDRAMRAVRDDAVQLIHPDVYRNYVDAGADVDEGDDDEGSDNTDSDSELRPPLAIAYYNDAKTRPVAGDPLTVQQAIATLPPVPPAPAPTRWSAGPVVPPVWRSVGSSPTPATPLQQWYSTPAPTSAPTAPPIVPKATTAPSPPPPATTLSSLLKQTAAPSPATTPPLYSWSTPTTAPPQPQGGTILSSLQKQYTATAPPPATTPPLYSGSTPTTATAPPQPPATILSSLLTQTTPPPDFTPQHWWSTKLAPTPAPAPATPTFRIWHDETAVRRVFGAGAHLLTLQTAQQLAKSQAVVAALYGRKVWRDLLSAAPPTSAAVDRRPAAMLALRVLKTDGTKRSATILPLQADGKTPVSTQASLLNEHPTLKYLGSGPDLEPVYVFLQPSLTHS